MSNFIVTVDVHDLEPAGPVPAHAELRISRALPDASGDQVVSTRAQTVAVGTGPTTVELTAGVVYRAMFTGVAGWESPFLFAGTVDTTLAELYRDHRVDPTSLVPVSTVPTVAEEIAALQAAVANGGGAGGGGTVADASTTSKGIIRLAGDLAGTAAAPTVPGLAAKANTASLATVATTGAYADLTGKPTIPAGQVNSDWNAASGVAQILNKPTLGTAATHPATDFEVAGAGATAQAYAIQRANHTGTQSADTIVDGNTNKAYTATEKTRLAAILDVTTLGSANNPVTNAAAARPTGLTKVFWQCSTQPTNALPGDEWINNS